MIEGANKLSVSVVMCTYNGATYLRQQLDSLVAQTYPLHELLIFDDVSSDGTAEILREYEARFDFIEVVVNRTNLGFTANFEQAVMAATGDMIAISDQDDVWMPNKIERMLEAWDRRSPLIYCVSLLFSKKIPANPRPHAVFQHFEGTDARRIFLRNTISGHTMMFTREFLKLVLPFPRNSIYYDWWMGVVAAYNGGVQHLREVLVMQRVHGRNISIDSPEMTVKQSRLSYKEKVINHCEQFTKAPSIPERDRAFAEELGRLEKESLNKSFHFPLFMFLLKNSPIVFGYKRKKFPYISYIKHSYLRTVN